MFEDDNVRIRHILDAAREAIAFAKSRTRADLDTERKPNLSLVRLLEIIGEADRGTSPPVCLLEQTGLIESESEARGNPPRRTVLLHISSGIRPVRAS